MYYTTYKIKLGKIFLISDGSNLIATFFENQKYAKNYKNLQKNDNLEVFFKAKQWYEDYFNGKKPNPKNLPFDLDGSDFKKKVYDILLSIPYGKTITYGEIAKLISPKKKMSAQAVGNAVAHNRFIIIVPCHRVLGKNNTLTGYAAGLTKKQWLLDFEKQTI